MPAQLSSWIAQTNAWLDQLSPWTVLQWFGLAMLGLFVLVLAVLCWLPKTPFEFSVLEAHDES